MRRFFIEPGAAEKPDVSITGSEARHIKNVLRLKPGDTIRLFDGTGIEYKASITNLTGRRAELSIMGKATTAAESPIEMTIAQGYLKEKKMDSLIPSLCELGMSRWMPFISWRSVPKPDQKRLDARLERWQKIARESLKQCRRSVLPRISTPVSFDDVLEFGRSSDLKILFWEQETGLLDRNAFTDRINPVKQVLIVLGPEGGFTDQEVEKARKQEFTISGLGPRILRAETATIAACTLMQFIFGDLR
jgi:16S rRNA (uracil1498-N3)-methyltransferase